MRRRTTRRAGFAAILSVAVLSGAALAQSPSPSPSASLPAASVIPSAAPAPSSMPGPAGAETCGTRLSDASITTVTGQTVTRADLGSLPSSEGFPAGLVCSWVLADGSVINLTAYWEFSAFEGPLPWL
ncbi:MAG: hypothetical protein LH650_04325 [Chloroflexi bacterium]|nr:hypothetical protein [Chloroflexota bacterium]